MQSFNTEAKNTDLYNIQKIPSQSQILKDQIEDLLYFPLDKQLLNKLFGQSTSVEALKDFFNEFPIKSKFVHMSIITQGEPYFRCIDCEVQRNETERTYLCRSCFENSNHKGHRFLLCKDSGGYQTCDCGDEDILNKDFSCQRHGTCSKNEYEKILHNFPTHFKTNFITHFKSILFELVYISEIAKRDKTDIRYRNLSAHILHGVIKTLNFSFEANNILIALVTDIITSNFGSPQDLNHLYYLSDRYLSKTNILTHQQHNLSYLENMLHYAANLKNEEQADLRKLILRMCKLHEFKERIVVSFHKMIHFQFIIQPQEVFKFTNLTYLIPQIYLSERNCIRVINNCTFNEIVDMVKQYIIHFQTKLDPDFEVLSRILEIFNHILEKEQSGRALLEKLGIMDKFLSILTEIQKLNNMNASNIEIKILNEEVSLKIIGIWDLEDKISKVLFGILKNVGIILDEMGRDQRSDLFLSKWKNEIELNNKSSPKQVKLNLPLQRAMILYLHHTLNKIESEPLNQQVQYIGSFFERHLIRSITECLNRIGTMRYCLIKSNMEIEKNEVVRRYFTDENGMSRFDFDFCFIQLFACIVEEESTDLFAILLAAYFVHDPILANQILKGDFGELSGHQILLLSDLLNFIVQLVHGEIPFFNAFYYGPYLKNHTSQKIFDQIHRKILICFLHKSYEYIPIAQLKVDFKYMLRPDLFHEKILKDISDIDKITRNFKLKKGFRSLFDSSYLFVDKRINDSITKNVRLQNKKNELIDTGNFTQTLDFLSGLKQLLYEGTTIKWIEIFLGKFEKKLAPAMRPILRIILLALKLLENSKKFPLSNKCKENIVFPFFSAPLFLDKLRKTTNKIDELILKESVTRIMAIFAPKSTSIATSLSESQAQFDFEENSKTMMINNVDLSIVSAINQTVNGTLEDQSLVQLPKILEQEEGVSLCGICLKQLDLENIDVGVPAFLSKSNMNYWEFKGKKYKMPFDNADKEEIRRIIQLIIRFFPYANGLGARELELYDDFRIPKIKPDFYPAVATCLHYFHKTCFYMKFTPISKGGSEFECPLCKSLNNIFIGMEKVDASSKKSIEEQWKRDKKFIDFLKRQGIKIAMLPDPNLKFDFYNHFLLAMFPKSKTIELKQGDPAADRKIIRFTNLLRSSFFQLVRNSLINDFESFISRCFLSYKFVFSNFQSFIIKNIQFHQFLEENQEMPFTVFHLLNHKVAMEAAGQPTVAQLREAFKVELGLDKLEKKEMREKALERSNDWNVRLPPIHQRDIHEHSKIKPPVPSVSGCKKNDKELLNNERYRQILLDYDFRGIAEHLSSITVDGKKLVMFDSPDFEFSLNKSHHHDISHVHKTDKSILPDISNIQNITKTIDTDENEEEDPFKDENIFDDLEKMLLLFESDLEEDFLTVFWEIYLKHIVTGRMKDYHTNIDLNMLPVDFLFLKTLSLIGKTLISEGVAKPKLKLPEFTKICEWINTKESIRSMFIEEIINITQRIIIATILTFDFGKCLNLSKRIGEMKQEAHDREDYLNKLFQLFRKDIKVNILFSPEIFEFSSVYPKFYAIWKANLESYLEISENPFALFVKHILEIRPLIIELPSNHNEFNSEYLIKICQKCEEFCNECRTVVCLLCGKILCREICSKKKKKKKKKQQDPLSINESKLDAKSVAVSEINTSNVKKYDLSIDRKGSSPKRGRKLDPLPKHPIKIDEVPSPKNKPTKQMLLNHRKKKVAMSMPYLKGPTTKHNGLSNSKERDKDTKEKPQELEETEAKDEAIKGNMHKHAAKFHKGHSIFIGIQDHEIILLSQLRMVNYPDKLYIDRFGQSLKEKVNMMEEDWNAFELNSLLLKRLRDVIENHKLPQLIYAISKGYELKKDQQDQYIRNVFGQYQILYQILIQDIAHKRIDKRNK